MNREKQIQIPEKLFMQMAAFCLMEEYRTEQNYKEIEKGIYSKCIRDLQSPLQAGEPGLEKRPK